VPAKAVADYAPEELARFRDAFRPGAERYRRCQQTEIIGILGIAIPGLLLFITSFVFPEAVLKLMFPWFLILFFILWVAAVCAFFVSGNLRCPACRNELETLKGPYCPECGARALKRRRWLRAPECSACGRVIIGRTGFGFRLRACSHCGVIVDEKGLDV